MVGNPCNTNALIAMNNAAGIPNDRFFAMTRLDENRAKSQLAMKAGVHCSDVTNLCIWGNHSATQYPDFTNAKIQGKPVTEVITDQAWLEGEFIKTVQQRGAAIIAARGASSAASAANAAMDTVKSLITPTPKAIGIPSPFVPMVPTASKKASWPPCRSAPKQMVVGKWCRAFQSARFPKAKSMQPSTS